jgi:hypothetical protein
MEKVPLKTGMVFATDFSRENGEIRPAQTNK